MCYVRNQVVISLKATYKYVCKPHGNPQSKNLYRQKVNERNQSIHYRKSSNHIGREQEKEQRNFKIARKQRAK